MEINKDVVICCIPAAQLSGRGAARWRRDYMAVAVNDGGIRGVKTGLGPSYLNLFSLDLPQLLSLLSLLL